jgi:hypothetical protein
MTTMTLPSIRILQAACVALAPCLAAADAHAAPFTGPTSPYYLDNYVTQMIYVVQGTSVINSFSWAYSAGNSASYNEANLAVTNVVTTNGFGSNYGAPATAGQYTLSGTPTGVAHIAQSTPGFNSENTFDGTSDGRRNYTVQYFGVDGSGNHTEDVIQTDANWQHPTVLFSVQSSPGATGEDLGITYDPTNNSLWISGYETTRISDYSLSGTLLSSFDTGQLYTLVALGLDHADNTLWISEGESNTLEQWSKTGVLLQRGIPSGLPAGDYLAGDFATTAAPEPASLALFGVGIAGIGVIRRRGIGHRMANCHCEKRSGATKVSASLSAATTPTRHTTPSPAPSP